MAPEARRLSIAYESQHDNEGGEGYRECFSSSCGAIARFYKRVADDDAYNVIRRGYGDTTNPQAQVRALRHLGLNARFITNGSPEILRSEVRAGRPVAVGWIHKGALPNGLWGDGHWSVVSGFNNAQVIHQDPYGEADMVRGGYVNHTRGADVPYSWANWCRRWEVMPKGRGYAYAPGTGWAVLVAP